ncbi:MAG: glycosyltransferase [Salinivirgaceae bacterium]|nr:glycosyltransferase [Salinivirgaceae bacterium]
MKLSVFVVTYNQEKYIRQCLDSILMQKVDFDYEVVIGEDHGTDGTRAICEEYAAKYPQVRLLPLKERLGIARNWQRVLSECKGEYIAMCEGDDYWTDEKKLQKQVSFLDENNEYVMSFHDATIIDENGNVISESKQGDWKKDISSEELILGNHPSTQTVTFRQNALPLILERMRKGYRYNNGDTVLFTLLGKYGNAKYQSEITNSVWRNHSSAAWSAINNIEKDISGYHTYTFLQKQYTGETRKKYLNARLNKLSRIVQNTPGNRMYKELFLYYLRFIFLSIAHGRIVLLWKTNKGFIYNLLK